MPGYAVIGHTGSQIWEATYTNTLHVFYGDNDAVVEEFANTWALKHDDEYKQKREECLRYSDENNLADHYMECEIETGECPLCVAYTDAQEYDDTYFWVSVEPVSVSLVHPPSKV